MTFDLDVSSTFGLNFKILRHLVLEKLMFPRQPTRSPPPAGDNTSPLLQLMVNARCSTAASPPSAISPLFLSSAQILSPLLTLFILHREESQEGPTEKTDEFTFKPVGLKRES